MLFICNIEPPAYLFANGFVYRAPRKKESRGVRQCIENTCLIFKRRLIIIVAMMESPSGELEDILPFILHPFSYLRSIAVAPELTNL